MKSKLLEANYLKKIMILFVFVSVLFLQIVNCSAVYTKKTKKIDNGGTMIASNYMNKDVDGYLICQGITDCTTSCVKSITKGSLKKNSTGERVGYREGVGPGPDLAQVTFRYKNGNTKMALFTTHEVINKTSTVIYLSNTCV